MVVVTACSLLWAVTGVSVLAVAYHEHHHHGETPIHQDAIEVVLHGHDHEGSPNHDHELTAPLSASRSSWSAHADSAVSRVNDQVDAEAQTARSSTVDHSEPRGLGPPAFLVPWVLLT